MQTLPPRPTPANMVSRVLLCNRLLVLRLRRFISYFVMPGLVPGIQPTASAEASGKLDSGDKRRNDTVRSVAVATLAVLLVAAFATAAVAQPASRPLRIVVLGDSLVAGFQLEPGDAFPAQLERALEARGHRVDVINAGVSGDTTATALERLAWAVPEGIDAVIVELGANDMLRGLDPARAEANLDRIVATLRAGGAEVLVAGMLAPRNLGEAYGRAFDAIYPALASKHGALLYPFFLDGVALDAKLNLSDGMHPNARGVAEITRRILPAVEELIARVGARRTAGSPG